jgi:regulator of replication initiation timing
MAKTGLQNEQLISELILSGSAIIKTKNEYGVHIFSGSVADDGVISGKLTKPKYNVDEVLKSLDTNIVELIPIEAPELPPTILLSAYDDANSLIAELTSQIEYLNKAVLESNSKVRELEIISQSLLIELDSKDLLLAVSQNQTQQATSKVQSSVVDLQNSIQKATAESIQRVSLFARNDLLDKQIIALNEQLGNAQGQIINLNNTINQLNIQLNNASAQANQAQTQAAAANTAAVQQSKKKKIICNELYNQGFLPQHIWNADEIYGEMMYEKDPRLVLGYMMWARNVVKYMKAKPQNTKWIYMMVKPWTEHMAYVVGTLPKDNWIGKLIHSVGKQYCYYVYDKQMSKRNKLSWQ